MRMSRSSANEGSDQDEDGQDHGAMVQARLGKRSPTCDDPRPGVQTLGPYQLVRKVGSGGMAEVWAARKRSEVAGHRLVALKILARHVAEDPRYREMFTAEARLSLALSHANIVSVFDVVEDNDECYMVMELIEGMTLSQLVRGLAERGETIPLDVAVYVIAELLRALAYAHGLQTEHGATIVHRDVSPQNVMVSTSGEVKLMDFGIARFSTEETSGNLIKGKLQYMPPEQLSKRTRAPTIDLFAVGAVLQELVDGRRFRGGVDQEILLGMVFRGEVPPMQIALPEPLARLRAELLEPDPDRRLQSARDALTQIYAWGGYRNASLELAEFVSQFVEPSSAISGAMPAVAPAIADEAATVARDVNAGQLEALLAQRAASPWSSTEPELDSEVDIGARAAATGGTWPEAETELATAIDPPLAAGASASEFDAPAGRRRGLLALAVAALLLILGLVAWRTGLFDGSEPRDPAPVATRNEAPDPPIQTAAAPEPASPVARPATPSEASEDEGREEPAADLAGPATDDASEDEAEAEVAPKPQKHKRAKVSVEFTASEFYFVYIKVAGRKLTLEPKKTTRLPVGTHAVYLRQKPDQDWRRAGTIKLARGASYKVEMKKPASLRLVKK